MVKIPNCPFIITVHRFTEGSKWNLELALPHTKAISPAKQAGDIFVTITSVRLVLLHTNHGIIVYIFFNYLLPPYTWSLCWLLWKGNLHLQVLESVFFHGAKGGEQWEVTFAPSARRRPLWGVWPACPLLTSESECGVWSAPLWSARASAPAGWPWR